MQKPWLFRLSIHISTNIKPWIAENGFRTLGRWTVDTRVKDARAEDARVVD